MKTKLFALFILLFLLAVTVSPDSTSRTSHARVFAAESPDEVPQSTQKQKFDYMSSILSRNTKPLGLKENVSLRKLLNQPSIIWAMRSEDRHILN
jgi:hypothetical protein